MKNYPLALKSLIQVNGAELETAKFETRDGRPARLICTDAKIAGEFDLVFLIEMEDGQDFIEWYVSTARRLDGLLAVDPMSSDDSVRDIRVVK